MRFIFEFRLHRVELCLFVVNGFLVIFIGVLRSTPLFFLVWLERNLRLK